MARNITVTFDDGTQHTYENAPDDISPEAVQRRAEAQFKKTVASMDGGRKSPEVALVEEVSKPVPPAVEPEPSVAAEIAANPLARFAVGAASPVLGAGEWLPGGLGRFFAENNAEMKRLVEEGKVSQSDIVKVLGGAGDVAGTVMSPAFLKLAQYLPAAKNLWQMVKQGAAVGALGGAVAPTGSADLKDKVVSTVTGAAVGGVATPVVSSIFRGFTNILAPMVSERAAERGAARMATKVAGEERAPDVARALSQAAPDQTMAQAAAPAGSYEMAALQRLMQANKPTEYGRVAESSEAARMAALRGVTPDVDAAIATRSATTAPLYEAAKRGVVDTRPVIADIDSLLRRQGSNSELRAELAKLRGNLVNTQSGKPYANAERVLSAVDSLKASIANKDNRYIQGELIKLKDSLTNAVPGYGAAQREFSRLSEPVNQATVLNRMAAELQKPTETGERITPFLNVLGKGEDALIKKSTGQPRYVVGDLEKVLTPQQFAVVDDIANQLRSGAKIDQMAKEGMVAALKGIRASESKDVRLPGLLNYKITVINSLLNRLEGVGGGKIEQKAAELMLPGNVRKLGGLMQQYQENPYGMFGTAMRYQGGVPSLFSREPIDVGTME